MKDHIIIHCSATPPTSNLTSEDIDRMHKQRGWSGTGYHVVICRDGTIETYDNGNKCRPLNQPGAHVGACGPGWNTRSFGICLIGGVDANGRSENNYTPMQWKSLEEVVLWLLEKYPSVTHIGGHRDLIRATNAAPKDCPCFDVATWYKEEVLTKDYDRRYAAIMFV